MLIAERSPLVRESLARMISCAPDLEVGGKVRDRTELIESVESVRPDAVILDADLAPGDPASLVLHVKQAPCHPRVVVFSLLGRHLERSIKAGADAFLQKDCSPSELLEAVRGPGR